MSDSTSSLLQTVLAITGLQFQMFSFCLLSIAGIESLNDVTRAVAFQILF